MIYFNKYFRCTQNVGIWLPEEYAPFISQEQFTKYSKGIAALELESERQIGCLFAADLVDPKNGFDAAATFLCPSLTSTLESSQSFLEKYDCKTGSEWKKSIWYPPKDEKEWIIFGSKKDSPSSYLTVISLMFRQPQQPIVLGSFLEQ